MTGKWISDAWFRLMVCLCMLCLTVSAESEGQLYYYRVTLQASYDKSAPLQNIAPQSATRHRLGVNVMLQPVWKSAERQAIKKDKAKSELNSYHEQPATEQQVAVTIVKGQLDSVDPSFPTGLEFPFYYLVNTYENGSSCAETIWIHKHDRSISRNMKRALVKLLTDGCDSDESFLYRSLFISNPKLQFLQLKNARKSYSNKTSRSSESVDARFSLENKRVETIDTYSSTLLQLLIHINTTQELRYQGPATGLVNPEKFRYNTAKQVVEHEFYDYVQLNNDAPIDPLPRSLDALIDETKTNLTTFIRRTLQPVNSKKLSKTKSASAVVPKSATVGAVDLLAELIDRIGNTTKDDILAELKRLNTARGPYNKHMLSYLIDAVAASQELTAFQGAQQFLNELQPSQAEPLRKRLYIALAFAVQPNIEILKRLSPLLSEQTESQELTAEMEELIALTIGAMVESLGNSKNNADFVPQTEKSAKSLVKPMLRQLRTKLQKCYDTKSPMLSAYARALANAKQLEDVKRLLLLVGDKKIMPSKQHVTTIIQAVGSILRAADVNDLNSLDADYSNFVVNALLDVFSLRRYRFDNSARIQALEALLGLTNNLCSRSTATSASGDHCKNIARALVHVLQSNQRRDREVAKFATSRVADMARSNNSKFDKFLHVVAHYLNHQSVKSYPSTLAKILPLTSVMRGGKSFTFRGELARIDAANASFDFDMGVEMESGMLKSSFMHVTMDQFPNDNAGETFLVAAENDAVPVNTVLKDMIKFHVFTSGLESIAPADVDPRDKNDPDAAFAAAADKTGEEEESAIGGVLVSLLGNDVSKQIFFEGLSGLMSLAWSAQADVPLAQSDLNLRHAFGVQEIPTPSGFTVKLRVSVDVSINIAGYLDLSLWNQYSKTTVQNRAAVRFAVDAQIPINSQHDTLHASTTDTAEARMDFRTVVDFAASPVRYCMQMHYNDVHYYRKSWTALEHRHSKQRKEWKQKVSSRSRKIFPGKSFYLGAANTKQCKGVKHLL